jgi:hypothetical protein
MGDHQRIHTVVCFYHFDDLTFLTEKLVKDFAALQTDVSGMTFYP